MNGHSMARHSHTRCLIHLIWSTLDRQRLLHDEKPKRISEYLYSCAKSNGIFMNINYVNPDHVHALIDLPTNRSLAQVVSILKGNSSHWINEQLLFEGRFKWGRGYGAFSVSESCASDVISYIKEQQKHHQRRTFAEEYEALVRLDGISSASGPPESPC